MKKILFLLVALTAMIFAASANMGWKDKDCDKWSDKPMMGAMEDHYKGQMDHCQNSMMPDRDHDRKQKMGPDHKATIVCVCKFGKSMMGKDKDDDKHMNLCDHPMKSMMNYGDKDQKSMMDRHGMGQKDKKKTFILMCTCQKVNAKSDDPAGDPPNDPPEGGEGFEGGEGVRGGEMGEGSGFEGAEFGEGRGFEGGEEEEGEFMPFFGDFGEPFGFGPEFGEEEEGEFMPREGVEEIR